MARRIVVLCLAVLALFAPVTALAQDARALLEQAAEAMGGLERLQALQNVTYTGFGQRAYYQGGGNVVGDPQAPMKWQNLADVQRTMHLRPVPMLGRHAVYRERWGQAFPFAGTFGLDYRPRTSTQRGIAMFDHPLPAVLLALEPDSLLGEVSDQDGLRVIAVTLAGEGGPAWIGIDPATHLPRFTRWVSGHANLGDLTTTAWFSGYLPFEGVQLPMGLMQALDWRGVTDLMFQVDSYRLDLPADRLPLGEPAEQPAPPAPTAPLPPPQAQVTQVAPGVWDVRVNGAGGAVVEFADHLVMFEAYGGEAQTLLRIDAANRLVPGKQVTAVIVSHHHFDHTGGLRAAVSRGLEVVSHRGNEGILRELVERPATRFPDALARNPHPLVFTPVDERLVLEDRTRRLEIYRVVQHSHMANGVFAYLPAEKIMLEGDLGDETWNYHFWGSAYAANIAHYGIAPETDVPVHGSGPLPMAQVLANTARQVAAAQELCHSLAESGRFQQGCPVQYDADGPLDLAPR